MQNHIIKHKKTFYALYCFVLVITFCIVAEAIVRLKGKKPWKPASVGMALKIDRRVAVKDDARGYVYAPGKHRIVTDEALLYTVTVLENNQRITHPLETYRTHHDKGEIWIYGCSYTFGHCGDDQTYPWLLQEKIPGYEVVNYGLGGGSTLQSLIWFREDIKKKKTPIIVIVAYASFHDARNSLSRKRRREVVPYIYSRSTNIPYARLDRNGKLLYFISKPVYKEFPLMRRSAFVAWLEEMYDQIEEYCIKSHEISKAIIKEFDNVCKREKISLIVAGITGDAVTQDMLNYCQREGMDTVDISVNLNRKGYDNSPYDHHPSGRANKEYAEKLYLFIKNRDSR